MRTGQIRQDWLDLLNAGVSIDAITKQFAELRHEVTASILATEAHNAGMTISHLTKYRQSVTDQALINGRPSSEIAAELKISQCRAQAFLAAASRRKQAAAAEAQMKARVEKIRIAAKKTEPKKPLTAAQIAKAAFLENPTYRTAYAYKEAVGLDWKASEIPGHVHQQVIANSKSFNRKYKNV
ncbi:MAG: hypothetical protein U5N55_01620 [Cypionkella sp.]|nr:hypothetical protein [Cypionkella sp.]